VLVPVKALPGAKSRLAGLSTDAEAHARLVHAIRDDTLRAAREAAGVARVVRIGDTDDVEHDLLQQRPGLNEALAEGAQYAAAQWPDDGIAALVGDLPALTAAELARSLAVAAHHETAFVATRRGTGTHAADRRGRPRASTLASGPVPRPGTAPGRWPCRPGWACARTSTRQTTYAPALLLGVGPAHARGGWPDSSHPLFTATGAS